MKDKGFTQQVPRDQLEKGATELGVPFDDHVLNMIEGLKTIRQDLASDPEGGCPAVTDGNREAVFCAGSSLRRDSDYPRPACLR